MGISSSHVFVSQFVTPSLVVLLVQEVSIHLTVVTRDPAIDLLEANIVFICSWNPSTTSFVNQNMGAICRATLCLRFARLLS